MIDAYWLSKNFLIDCLMLSSVNMKGISSCGYRNEIDHLAAVGLSYCTTLCERCYT